MKTTRGVKSILKRASIKKIKQEIRSAEDKVAELTVAFNNLRNQITYYRNKRDSLESLLFERQQGQLPLLEHEMLGGENGQQSVAR